MRSFITRSLLAASLGLLLGHQASSAQTRRLQLGDEPTAVFVDPQLGLVHILTAGHDINFDNIYQPESGEVPARWYVVDPATEEVVASKSFDCFFNSFPIRVGVDYASNRLYAPQLGRIRVFDLRTQELLRDTLLMGRYAMVSFDSLSGMLMLADRPSYSDPGTVTIYDPAAGATLAVIAAGVNTAMSIGHADASVHGVDFYTISEGGAAGQIGYSSVQPDVFQAVNGHGLGGGASQVIEHGGKVFVVLNGTHEVRIIDPLTHAEVSPSPIAVGTAGFDGPRAVEFEGDSVLLVGTYHGDVRRFDLKTGMLRDSIATSGKIEALAVRGSLLYAALKYQGESYTPDTHVAVIDLEKGRVIDSLTVGEGPGALFFDRRGDLHVLGYGASDTVGWWMVFDGATHAMKASRQLHGQLGFPLRVGYDPGEGTSEDSVVIALSDSLYLFSASSPSSAPRLFYVDTTATGDIVGAGGAGQYVTANELPKNFGSDPGYVHVIDRKSGRHVAKVRAGAFLDMVTPIPSVRPGVSAFYAVSEGAFGSPSSTLTRFAFAQNILGNDTTGPGPNHIVADGDHAYVTVTGNGTVAEIGFDDWRVRRRIDVGASGFNGPRETLPLPNGDLAVSTYAGDVRVVHGSSVVRTIKTSDRAEGLATIGGKIFVANPFHADYSSDSTVTVIDLSAASVRGVASVMDGAALDQSVPNPASTGARIRFSLGHPADVRLRLYAIDGRPVAELADRRFDAGSYDVEVPVTDLPAGSYLYVLRAGDEILTRTMQVVR
jgi:hypothetical protein